MRSSHTLPLPHILQQEEVYSIYLSRRKEATAQPLRTQQNTELPSFLISPVKKAFSILQLCLWFTIAFLSWIVTPLLFPNFAGKNNCLFCFLRSTICLSVFIPYCFDDYNFIVQLEIRKCDVTCFDLFSSDNFLGHSGNLWFHIHFRSVFFFQLFLHHCHKRIASLYFLTHFPEISTINSFLQSFQMLKNIYTHYPLRAL